QKSFSWSSAPSFSATSQPPSTRTATSFSRKRRLPLAEKIRNLPAVVAPLQPAIALRLAPGGLARDFHDAGAERVPRVRDQAELRVTLKARVRHPRRFQRLPRLLQRRPCLTPVM